MSEATRKLSDDVTRSDMGRKERRRFQNRLNQRAWRERQRARKQATCLMEERALQYREEAVTGTLLINPRQHYYDSSPDLGILARFSENTCQSVGSRIGSSSCLLPHPYLYHMLSVYEAAAYRSSLGNPQADHLLTLAKLNVFRAFVRNIAILGYTREWMTDDSLSRFSINGPFQLTASTHIPPSLRPTELQQSRPHHPWLDFFPFARLRDNLIRNQDSMDDSQFCRDLMGFWTMPDEANCMLVWGDPWIPMNWELTETFLKKWGGLVKGCPEILWSTNQWRQLRGEKRLAWRASFDTVMTS
ncbi:hypothetical protein AbraIFM66950_010451 [Aspergillus brasiliensis]|nr:hypothetical protein AbraIFM66950_010451 [Aspergillus brasiliensis]